MRKIVVLASALLILAAPLAYGQAVHTTACKVQDGTYPVNTEVFIDSLVVTGIDLKPSTYGLWGMHPQPCPEYPNGAYSGVMIYMSYARPDTIGGIGVEIGDLISVRGNIEEYPSGGVPSVTEIAAPSDSYGPRVTIIQEDYGVPEPIALTVHNFGTDAADSANCEKWEGVYCMVDTIVCTFWYEPLEYAEWGVVELEDFTGFKSTDTLRVDDKLVDPSMAKPDIGDTLRAIKGIFSYEYGNYKIWPPSNDHVEYISAPPAPNVLQVYSRNNTQIIVVFDRDVDPVTSGDTDNYSLETVDVTSAVRWATDTRKVTVTHTAPTPGTAEVLTVCNIKNMFDRPMPQCQQLGFRIGVMPVSFVQTPKAGSDTSQVVNEQVTIAGICTGGSLTFGGFYLGTPGGGPYSGVYVFDSANQVELGDSVIVSSLVNEYYGLTEMYLPQYVNPNLLTMTPPLSPVVIDPADLAVSGPDLTAEQWEGVLVKVESVVVATSPDEFGEWNVHAATDTVHVDNGDYTYEAVRGDTLDVAGLVDYAFDVWTIRPRDDDDIVIIGLYGSVDEETMSLHFKELTNYPNPFNPKTVVEFGLAHASPVKLTVYDVNGRAVRTLVEEEMQAGTYQVLWNGNDSNGRPVAAGVYYCRLEAGDRLEMKKLVLVK